MTHPVRPSAAADIHAPKSQRGYIIYSEKNMTDNRDISVGEILSRCDHTLLAQDATWSMIKEALDDGIKYGVASACIPPCFVARAREYVGERLPICTVIGFPLGYCETEAKITEASAALANGADELDMVINIGALREGRRDYVQDEISALKDVCGEHILKVIIETCLLSEDEKKLMCELVSEAHADFIKTSTGFSTGGATREDVALLRRYVAPEVRVKAAGGIKNLADAADFIRLGADRLGTSRIVRAVKSAEKNS